MKSNLPVDLKVLLTDSCSFWERMRIPYNTVLATLSIACWGREMLSGRVVDFVGGLIVLGVFGLAANVCYCAAYPVDLALQLSPMRSYRGYSRWVLFVCGLFFASVCALYVLLGDHMA